MIDFIRNKTSFILLCVLWCFAGWISAPVSIFFVLGSLVLMYYKFFLQELLLGFLFVLVLSDSFNLTFSWAKDFKMLYILFLGFFVLKDFKRLNNSFPIYKYFIPFISFAFLCLIKSPNPLVGFQKTVSYFLLFLIIPNLLTGVYGIFGERVFRELVWTILLILLLGIILHFVNPSLAYGKGRFRGLFGNPNGLGIFCLLFFILFEGIRNLHKQIFNRNEIILVYSILFISLFLSGARSSIIALCIFFVFSKIYNKSSLLGWICFILFLIVAQFISSHLQTIILNFGLEKYFRVETLDNASGRLVAWDFAWKNINENFFMGKGISYCEYLFIENQEFLNMLGHQGHAHNSFLTLWLDTGLIGLTFFLIAVFSLFNKMAKTTPLAIPALFAILFSNQFESWITASLNPYTILLLLFVCVVFIKQNESIGEDDLKKENRSFY